MHPNPIGFAQRWQDIARRRGPLCLGIAPSMKWLAAWDLSPDLRGAEAYCRIVLDVGGDDIGAYKVQLPFFEQFGLPGLSLLRLFVDEAHARGAVVVLDAKRGDADDTMDALASMFLGPNSALAGDAVTANAFMGFDSLEPLFTHAHRSGSAVFVMVRTSNHQAATAQLATTPAGLSVAQHLADSVHDWNVRVAGIDAVGPVGAVVGARLPESADLLDRLRSAVVEVPGLGRGDRQTDEVMAPCAAHLPHQAMLTLTTGVLKHGPDRAALSGSVRQWRTAINERTGVPVG